MVMIVKRFTITTGFKTIVTGVMEILRKKEYSTFKILNELFKIILSYKMRSLIQHFLKIDTCFKSQFH